MKTKILHWADLHIDHAGKYGHINPKTGLDTMVEDKLQILDEMIDHAIKNDIKIILDAGDTFNTVIPSPTMIRLFSERVKRITDAGIHIVFVEGNHSLPKNPKKRSAVSILQFISPLVHYSDKPEILEIEGVQVATLPWIFQSRFENLEMFAGLSKEEVKNKAETMAFEMFTTLIASSDPEKPLVTVAHATVSGSEFGAERVVMMGHDIVIPHTVFLDEKICYSALGHIHKHQYVGEKHIVYAGTSSRMSFNERNEKKGFITFEVETGKRAEWEFVETNAREFREINIGMGDDIILATQEILTDHVAKIKVTGEKSELATFDFDALQKRIEEYKPHSYEIVKIIEKEDRDISPEISGNLEELSPVQILEKFSEKKKLKKGETKKMLEEAKNILGEIGEKSEGSETGAGGFLPKNLHLKNFCSHSDTVLDFEKIEQAVLSGENGAGKSSLIDSLFWVVWGVSRTKSDDDLVRQNTVDMSVEFEFFLGKDEYKIVRTRNIKTKTSKGTLDLYSGKNFADCLSENSTKETQAKIISLLGMSSEIFQSSAYLRQGEGDLFSATTPAKRKEILAELLNLSVWGEIEEKTKEKRKENGGKTDRFLAQKEIFDAEISQENEVQEKISEHKKAVSEKKSLLKTKNEELKILEYATKNFTTVNVQKKVCEDNISREKNNLQKFESEISGLKNAKESFRKILQNKEKILDAVREVSEKKTEKENLRQKREKFLEEKSASEKIAHKKQMLESEISDLSRKISEEKKSTEKNIQNIQNDWENERLRIIEQGKSLKIKIENSGTDCPLCKAKKDHQHANPFQELEDENTKLRQHYNEREGFIENRIREISQDSEYKIKKFSQELSEKNAEISGIIVPIIQEVDTSKIENLSQEISELEKFSALKGNLDISESRLREIEARTTVIAQEKISAEECIQKNEKKLAELPKLDESMITRIEQKKLEISPIETTLGYAQSHLSVAQNNLEKISEKKEELKKLEKENKEILEKTSALDLLIEASGKNGAIAMVIDSVIPEIEKETNTILQKISDGKMSVKFSTTREKKSVSKKQAEISGSSVETLDISVETENGELDHSLLSGGEKFRIDFAIRIALSKILARRAGTQIRFLMIDEAGTALDEAGKTAFVQSLHKISDEFEKILFITHLEDLKSIFETQVMVEKSNGESFISIF